MLSLELNFESFSFAFKTTLDHFGPLKQKIVWKNNQPLMIKTLDKAITKRSKLKNKLNKKRNAKDWYDYRHQWNYCSSLLKES